MDDLKIRELRNSISGESRPFAQMCLDYLDKLGSILKIISGETNKGELAAFISFAIAFPTGFLASVDMYDVLKSGVPNFLAVALALHEYNYQALGLHLDSGDLTYLSLEVRKRFTEISEKFNLQYTENFTIMTSNYINKDILISLEKQEHAINTFGIETHFVTCQKQPTLGCVDGSPRLKLSQDIQKVTILARKNLYRLK